MKLKLIVGALVLLNLALLTMLLARDGSVVRPVSALTAPPPETASPPTRADAPAQAEATNGESVTLPAAAGGEPAEPPAPNEAMAPFPAQQDEPTTMARFPAQDEPTALPPAESPPPEPVTPTRPDPAPRQAPAPVRPAVPAPRQQPPAAPTLASEPPAPVATTVLPPPSPRLVSVPVGTSLPVRLVNALHSRSLEIGQSFSARLDEDLYVGDDLVARAGSRVSGAVRDIKESGRVQGVETLVLALESLEAEDGRSYRIETSPATFAARESHKRDAATIGGASAVGAIIGGIAKGGKGAATGAAAGAAAGAGVVLSTRGEPVHLEAGTRLIFTLEHELRVTVPPEELH